MYASVYIYIYIYIYTMHTLYRFLFKVIVDLSTRPMVSKTNGRNLAFRCRIYVERGKFCWTAVNWLDIILAVITCMDVWILRPMALSGGATDQMILLRFMRAVKSMRAIRMVILGSKPGCGATGETKQSWRGSIWKTNIAPEKPWF